jgi:hypothetical protein
VTAGGGGLQLSEKSAVACRKEGEITEGWERERGGVGSRAEACGSRVNKGW